MAQTPTEHLILYAITTAAEAAHWRRDRPMPAGAPADVLVRGDLAAVVGTAGGGAPEAERALAHANLLQSLLPSATIIPVKFGTMLEAGAIVRLLEAERTRLLSALAELRGRIELGLQAAWRPEELRQRLQELAGEREVQTAKRRAQADLGAALALGELIQAKMAAKVRALQAELLPPLVALAAAWRQNPMLTERMVLNAAFLVAKEHQTAFDEAVGRLAEARAALEFKYSGPWPPYNFVAPPAGEDAG